MRGGNGQGRDGANKGGDGAVFGRHRSAVHAVALPGAVVAVVVVEDDNLAGDLGGAALQLLEAAHHQDRGLEGAISGDGGAGGASSGGADAVAEAEDGQAFVARGDHLGPLATSGLEKRMRKGISEKFKKPKFPFHLPKPAPTPPRRAHSGGPPSSAG